MDFLSHLFDTSGFPPRWHCGNWSPGHGWLHILSDLGVWSAYFAIPVVLLGFVARRRDLPFRRIFGLFGAFILLCGSTHLMEAIIFWWPAYRLAGVLKLTTALVSWTTVLALIRVAPTILAIRSPEDLQREIVARQEAERRLQLVNEELEHRVEERTTELSAAVAALRDERELLETTLGSIGDGVIVADTLGRVTFVNAAAETLTGWTAVEASGRPLSEVFRVVDEVTRDPVESPALSVVGATTVSRQGSQAVLLTREGAERPIDDTAAPIRGASGQERGAVLVFRDITGSRRAEREMAGLVRRLTSLMDNTPLAVIEWDPEFRVTRWSGQAEAVFGWSADEVLGVSVDALPLVYEGDRAEVDRVWTQLEDPARTCVVSHNRNTTKSGRIISCEWYNSVLHDEEGRMVAVLSLVLDVTERDRAERDLRESQRRFQSATEAIVGVVYESDLETGRVERSSGLLGLVGFRPDEAEPTADWWWSRVNPDDAASATARFREASERGESLHAAEYRVRHRDGSERHVWDRAVLVRDEAGRLVRTIGCTIDISERKRVEKERQRLVADLESKTAFLEAVVRQVPVGIVVAEAGSGNVLVSNPQVERIAGLPLALGLPIAENDGLANMEGFRPGGDRYRRADWPHVRSLRGELVQDEEIDLQWPDGARRTVLVNACPVSNRTGQILAAVVAFQEITSQKRAAASLAGQKRVLEMVATDAPLVDVLATLCLVIEGQEADLLCLVLLLGRGGRQMWVGAGPSLPEDFVSALNGIPIGPPYNGPCDMAIDTGEELVVPDTRADARWSASWRALVERHGLRSCRTAPILGPEGEVLGTIAGYRRRPSDSEPADPNLMDLARQLASIAILRKRADDRVRESERRLRLALTAARMVAWEYDAGADRITATDNLAPVFGLAPGMRLDRLEQSFALIHPDDAERHRAAFRTAIADRGSFRSQFRIIRPDDGAVSWLEERGQAVADETDGAVRLVGVVMDITDRKRTSDELQQRKEELETLLETLPVPVNIAHDPGCRTITGNRAAHDLLRVPVRHNFSKSAPTAEVPTHFRICRDGVEVPPDRLPIQRAARGEPVRGEEYEVVFDDGTVVNVELSAAPLHDDQGRARGAVASALEITERKRAERALRESDRLKDEFIATLAHELRNPLAPIRNALHILRIQSPPDPDLEWSRDVIGRQVDQMVRLLEDLLDVSRITRSKLTLRKDPVALSTIIETAVETSRPVIAAGGHELTVTLPAEPVTMEADPVRLAQVFANLLNNAAKYTDRGGQIRLTAERTGSDLVVSVKDTGIGIAPEVIPQIFQTFSQATPALERSQGGLGIGLSLVKGLVELHDGRVEVRSDGPGTGSEFIVRLPVNEPTIAAPVPVAGSSGALPPCKVVVADDNRDSADSLSRLLRFLGSDVRTAYDGQEAVELVETFQPDAAILDIGMPMLNGYQAARLIREQPGGDEVFLIALTGWGQEEDRRRSHDAGFNAHLIKPVDPYALEELIRTQPLWRPT